MTYQKLEIKLSQTLTDYFANNSSNPPTNWNIRHPIHPNGHSYGSFYLEANFIYSPYPKWKTSWHLGYQSVTNYPQLNYLDCLVMLSYEFPWFELTLSYVNTNARQAFYNVPNHAFKALRKNLGGKGLILGIDHSF